MRNYFCLRPKPCTVSPLMGCVWAPKGTAGSRALLGFQCQGWGPSRIRPSLPPRGLSGPRLSSPSALPCIEEIVAHASNVSSLVLGKASGRLLATGGDDCRVNLWSINKPNCIMVRFGRWAGWGRWADQGWALGVGSSAETQHISAPPTLVCSGKSRTTQMAGTVASPQE